MGLSSLQLDAFLAVARSGTLSAAAIRLGLTQSALSQRLFKLEEELETILFIREPRGMKLTQAGEKILHYCLAREGLEAELIRGLGVEKFPVTEIRFAAYSTVARSCLLPCLSPWLKANPGVRLSLTVGEMAEQMGLLRSGAVDFALTDFSTQHSGVCCELLGEENYVLVAPRVGGPEGSIYLDLHAEDPITVQFLRRGGKEEPNLSRHFLGDIYGVLDAVEEGWGQAVVPRHLLRGRKKLAVVPRTGRMKVPVYLNYVRQPIYPKRMAELVQHLKTQFKEFLV